MPPTAKTSSATRRASSGLAKVSTPPSSNRTTKASKASKILRLKLPSEALARFAPHPPDDAPSPVPPTKQVQDAVAPVEEEPKPISVKPEKSSPPPPHPTGSATPQPPPKDPSGKNITKASSPKIGSKRGLGAGLDGTRPRARPGPKKKLKMEEANNGENVGSAAKGSSGPTAPAHKLGPKANQGAINAGLRALDRTGKPCKKWHKNGFRVKTFTGVTWEIRSWRAPTNSLDSEGTPEKGSFPTSNSQSKDNQSSSHVGSENSSATPNGYVCVKNDPANSPLPAIALAT
ncbi:MAG: hypothetical protein Q9193_005882 [Seirophora villosa]